QQLHFQLTRLRVHMRPRVGGWNVQSSIQWYERQPLAPRQAVAFGENYPPEPARKGTGFAELSEFPPSCDECLLRGVFGEVEVTQHGIRAGKGHVLVARNQLAEPLVSLRERATRIDGSFNQ